MFSPSCLPSDRQRSDKMKNRDVVSDGEGQMEGSTNHGRATKRLDFDKSLIESEAENSRS